MQPTHRDLTGDEQLDDLIVFFGVRGYRTPSYWPAQGIIMSKSDIEKLRALPAAQSVKTGMDIYGWTPWWGVPLFEAPDWACDLVNVAGLRFIATLRRHRWFRRAERILGWRRGTGARR